jgi:squalene-hopene/tetraprenyl-beta-curcumene cyclase
VKELARLIERKQNKDGGWGSADGAASDPFMTGQALYALRNAGRSDGDRVVVTGTKWLLDHQRTDGGWSDGGFGKAEAMWAVLGLVSMDKVSIDVAGLVDGAHVDGRKLVKASAADNAGGKVKELRLFVDDVVKHTACGPALEATLDAAALTAGAHTIDVVAKTSDGKESRRRLMVYAGDAYLHEVGARFDGAATVIGLRDIAPEAMGATVKLTVVDEKNKVVREESKKSAEGPMSFTFAGDTRGRYTAKVSLVDATGKARDTQEIVFTHDTPEAQKARFAEVAGAVNGGEGQAFTNTEVELVDDKGQVVQKTKTTRSGQYRFQNVDSGKYKVRVKKDGFRDWEAPLDAQASKEAAAPAAAMEAK